MVNDSKHFWPIYFAITIPIWAASLFINISIGGLVEEWFLDEIAKTMKLWNIGNPDFVVQAFKVFFTISDYVFWVDTAFIVVATIYRFIHKVFGF